MELDGLPPYLDFDAADGWRPGDGDGPDLYPLALTGHRTGRPPDEKCFFQKKSRMLRDVMNSRAHRADPVIYSLSMNFDVRVASTCRIRHSGITLQGK